MPQRKRNRAGRVVVRIAVYALTISIITLYILALTGCTYTNTKIPKIFLAQIQNPDTSIYVGFYGLCTNASSCTPTPTTRPPSSILAALFPTQGPPSGSTTALVTLALSLQQKIFLSPLLITTAAAALFLVSLPSTALTRLMRRRRARLGPGPRLRWLRIFTVGVAWLSAALAFTAAVLAVEMAGGVRFVLGAVGDGGQMSVSAGGLLRLLLGVISGLSAVFAVVVGVVLGDGRGGRGVDFEKGMNEFEDGHIIVF